MYSYTLAIICIIQIFFYRFYNTKYVLVIQSLDIIELLDVPMSFSWVYYKTKGYKKSLTPQMAQGS